MSLLVGCHLSVSLLSNCVPAVGVIYRFLNCDYYVLCLKFAQRCSHTTMDTYKEWLLQMKASLQNPNDLILGYLIRKGVRLRFTFIRR